MAVILNIGSSSDNVKFVKIDDSIKNVQCVRLIPTNHPDKFEFRIETGYLVVTRVDHKKGWSHHHQCEIKNEILDMTNINSVIKNEGLQVCVVSYGGCRSNTLVDVLEKNDIKCRTRSWNKLLCHCPEYFQASIPVIYIYDDPIKSLLSMKRRGPGFWDANQQKMSNNYNAELSDENLLKLMIKQFKSWTSQKDDNVIIIKSSEIHQPHIVKLLENHLSHKITGLPILYKKSSNHKIDVDNSIIVTHKTEIDMINNYNNI